MRSATIESGRIALQALRVNPLRTLLSTLGIIMGVASLVAVFAVGDGLERYAREQIATTSSLQVMAVVPRTTRMVDGQRFPRADYVRFTLDDAEQLGARLGRGGAITVTRNGRTLASLRPGEAPRAAGLVGTGAGYPAVAMVEIDTGRFFTGTEARQGARVVVITPGLASALAQDSATRRGTASIGDTIYLGASPWTVIGITRAGAADLRMAFVPLPAADGAFAARTGDPAQLLARGATVEDVESMRRSAEAWLAERWPGGDQAEVQTQQGRVEQARRGMLLFKLFMGAITGISLLVGGIGIMNVLLAAVAERTREIGIRKATGARQRDIMFQFLAESLTITGVGAFLGVLLGLGGAFLVTAIMRAKSGGPIQAAFTWPTVIFAATAAIVIGLAFGTYPALRAARLSPIDAIRHE